MTNEDDLTNE